MSRIKKNFFIKITIKIIKFTFTFVGILLLNLHFFKCNFYLKKKCKSLNEKIVNFLIKKNVNFYLKKILIFTLQKI